MILCFMVRLGSVSYVLIRDSGSAACPGRAILSEVSFELISLNLSGQA